MKVLLPGSYDPVTLGHVDLIKRAAAEYDEVFATVFVNDEKKYTFSEEERVEMLSLAVSDIPNVTVGFYGGYVVDYMKEKGIDKIVKGYRNEKDLEYERVQAEYNFSHGGYATELYKCRDDLTEVSSTLARERILSGESLDGILPGPVIAYIRKREKIK